MSEPTEVSYFQQRISSLGIESPAEHTITNYAYGSYLRGDDNFQERTFEIFQQDDEGNIKIFYPTLEGLKYQWKQGDNRHSKDYFITRLKLPKGDRKYNLPKGAGTFPFFPPGLIRKYQDKEKITTLFLTEGAFKSYKGDKHGIDIVGLTSITHVMDRYTLGLHEDIKAIIKTCQVQRVVFLVDGDCNNISSKPIQEIEDLYRRPHQFFSSAQTFSKFLSDFTEVEKWFVHPLSDELEDLNNPKGLDDLLVATKGQEQDVVRDLLTFAKKGGWKYFHKIDITFSSNKLYKYFNLSSPDDFYLFHSQKRKELNFAKEFVFNGTRYRWNDEKNTCEVIVPGDAKNYFRVGDQYHEKILIPNKYKELEQAFHRRMKSTITDDYGKDFAKHIPKYKAFCNAPDHQSYQQVINFCYNMYGPFEHEADEGECETTLAFLKHIFGNKEITYTHPKSKDLLSLNEFELGLDYVQLLYQQPTQILPIVCLVSKENNTGKSTFAKWLKMLFTQNVAIVGNADLANDFNASWASKLAVICDEAKIDKQVVIEKIKALSTADKIFMNAKGKDQIEIDFFAKFILLTNNEENFIYASEEDVRYWIRKVPVITDLKVGMLQEMLEEIPAFLNFLNKRRMKTDCVHRAWFAPELIRTEALMKVIQNSRPTIEKEIRSKVREIFFDFGVDEILLTAGRINEEFFKGKYESNYLLKVLKDDLKLLPKANKDGKLVPLRYSFPKWERVMYEGKTDFKPVEIRDIGRPFVFPVNKFLTADEIEARSIDPEVQLQMDYKAEAEKLGDPTF